MTWSADQSDRIWWLTQHERQKSKMHVCVEKAPVKTKD